MKMLLAPSLISLLLIGNSYAFVPLQQKISLVTKDANINTNIPFKVKCEACTNLIKQDDHTYFIDYLPIKPAEVNHMTFTYQYGNDNDSCIYNADVTFMIINDTFFYCSGNQKSILNQVSTSKDCPPKVALFSSTKKDFTELYLDW